MKILVRLPNWLGDMVMSVGAIHQLSYFFPNVEVSIIAKKGLHDLLAFFPKTKHQFIFSKEEYKGLKGVWKFGRMIKKTESFDLFISFPDSFSSALMGYATGARKRIGYKKELRHLLLTDAYTKSKDIHRVEEYVQLLEQYAGKRGTAVAVALQHPFLKRDHFVININSEASSRRLTIAKAVEIIEEVRAKFPNKIVLIGSPNEKKFVEEVLKSVDKREGIESVAGKTSLQQLCEVLASAQLVLTTDSGPAHLSNALGTQTVVLFGAGNENNTAPYNSSLVQTIRLGKLSCEPCTKNVCVKFGTPQCLELLDAGTIIAVMNQKLMQWK
ncbi:MAG TPA: glycosyltransferase family 9 protein [Flavisolibacter sp.]|jgi:ADP-heptose:LPS heptosyltransferase|nr:glycosyltransferase family 9 protein [Flavisolibacter sp.]